MRGWLGASLNGEISVHALRVYAELFTSLLHGIVDTAILIVRDDADMRRYNVAAQLDS
ncbi:hypothetical protein D3C77_218410 [compost metagenome]